MNKMRKFFSFNLPYNKKESVSKISKRVKFNSRFKFKERRYKLILLYSK